MALDEHMRADLVEDALKMAITLGGKLPETGVFHTDYAEDDVKPRNRADVSNSLGATLVLSA